MVRRTSRCTAARRSYHRSVYPSSLFERRRKYNVAVQMSRHPELNDYVFEVRMRLRQRCAACFSTAVTFVGASLPPGPKDCSTHVYQGTALAVRAGTPYASDECPYLCNAQGQVERVDVVIMGARGVPHERLMFEVR